MLNRFFELNLMALPHLCKNRFLFLMRKIFYLILFFFFFEKKIRIHQNLIELY